MITRSIKRRCGKDINFSPEEEIIVGVRQNQERGKLSAIDSDGKGDSLGLHLVFPDPVCFSEGYLLKRATALYLVPCHNLCQFYFSATRWYAFTKYNTCELCSTMHARMYASSRFSPATKTP